MSTRHCVPYESSMPGKRLNKLWSVLNHAKRSVWFSILLPKLASQRETDKRNKQGMKTSRSLSFIPSIQYWNISSLWKQKVPCSYHWIMANRAALCETEQNPFWKLSPHLVMLNSMSLLSYTWVWGNCTLTGSLKTIQFTRTNMTNEHMIRYISNHKTKWELLLPLRNIHSTGLWFISRTITHASGSYPLAKPFVQ